MEYYTKVELDEAILAISSTISKCEKVLPKLKPGSSQQTLLTRRIKALRMALTLLKREADKAYAMDPGPFYHGTKAALKAGDLLEPGYRSNYGARRKANYVYLTATFDAAIWGAELADGEEPGKIYRVEPTGPIEDDPNLTDKKFPGNPTRSYRTQHPLRIVGEIREWTGHSAESLQTMRDNLDQLKRLGIEAIDE